MAKVKVPKRVGGVKVPKKLRKQAKQALSLVDSPAARDLALAGLAIAAESFIDRGRAQKTAKSAASEVVKQARGGKKLQDAIRDGLDGMELGEMLRAAAAEGARRFLAGFEEGQRAARTPAKPASAAKRTKAAKTASAARSPGAAKRKGNAKPASAAKPASPAKAPKSGGAAKKPTRRKPSRPRSGAAAG